MLGEWCKRNSNIQKVQYANIFFLLFVICKSLHNFREPDWCLALSHIMKLIKNLAMTKLPNERVPCQTAVWSWRDDDFQSDLSKSTTKITKWHKMNSFLSSG